MSIDLSNVIALALGSDDVLQIQDAIGTVLWQKTIYYNVSISAGSNGTVSVNGVSGNYSQSVPSGTVLTVEGTGNTGYNFDEWSDGNTDNPRTITVTGDLTLTASFESAVLPNYFYVENINNVDRSIVVSAEGSTAPNFEVFYSTDQTNWTSGGTTSSSIWLSVPANSKMYIKAITDKWYNNSDNYVHIWSIYNFNVGGNIMSLLYGDNFANATLTSSNAAAFVYLFYNSESGRRNLVSAENLILPSNTVASCYQGMFRDCTSLTTAPATLPATTLNTQCYTQMFWGCTSLTTAPALPVTTLANNCYLSMFYGCTSLTTAPVLPATTLPNGCYSHMFNGCTSLTSVITYANDISASYCLKNWLNNVAPAGDFYNLGSATYERGESGIPTGWTEHTSL